MPHPDPDALRRQITDDLFGGPLIQNAWRGEWAERLVLAGLGPGWRRAGADWAPYDLEREDGLRLEVKQAAARQSWHGPGDPPSRPAFDIRPRTGYYEGAAWRDAPGRQTDVYVFAWHPVTGEACDHTAPAQWRSYAVRAGDLPDQKTIGLAYLSALAAPVPIDALAAAVRTVAGRPSRRSRRS